MEEDESIKIENEIYLGLIPALVKSLNESKISVDKIKDYGKTKIMKLVCRLSDELNLPLTISWYRHGEYPFLEGLDFNFFNLLIECNKNINEFISKLSYTSHDIFEKAYKHLKKINLKNIYYSNLYLFLEKYYLNEKFNSMPYIHIYRNFFYLNRFIESDFIPKFTNNKCYMDYSKTYLDEEEIINKEFDRKFLDYSSQSGVIRTVFNRFLMEIVNETYILPEDIINNLYDAYNLYEKLCLRIDNIANNGKINENEIKNFYLIKDKFMFFWGIFSAHISTLQNKGLRIKSLKKYYENQRDFKLKEVSNKLNEITNDIRKSDLSLSSDELKEVIKKNKAMDIIHEFALRG